MGCFVVEALELWAEAAGCEEGMDALVAGNDLGGLAVLEGLSEDGVAVVVVDDEEIVVAPGGGDDELAWEIVVDLAGDGFAADVDVVCSADGRGDGDGWLGRLGGADVGTLLVEVTEGRDQGLGQVLADSAGGETGPRGEETAVDGVDPGGDHGVPSCRVEESDAGAGCLDGQG